jgi:hypothetical protein
MQDMKDLKDYTTLELTRELWSRSYDVYNPKEYATDTMWLLDDAIDTYNGIKSIYFTEYELTHEQLMKILNDTISSLPVLEKVSEKLYENIYQNLFED